MLTTLHLASQGCVAGDNSRSTSRPESIVEARDARATPARSSTSPIDHVSGTRARIEASFSKKKLDGRVRLLLLPPSPFALNREHPSLRGCKARSRRCSRRRGRFLCPVCSNRGALAVAYEAGDVLSSPVREVRTTMSVRIKAAVAGVCRGRELTSVGGGDGFRRRDREDI